MSSQYFRFNARAAQPHRAAEPRRAALLERLLARAAVCAPIGNWREDAFRVLAPESTQSPAVAAAALYADCGAVEAPWVCLATPVRCVADMSSVRMTESGVRLQQAAAEALARDFDRVWRDAGVRMLVGRAARLYCIFERSQEVATCDPEDVLGNRIENFLPTGVDARRLLRLMSELEMWLFEGAHHARNPHEAIAPSGLWLWGGGAALKSLPRVPGFVAGDDVYFDAFKDVAGASGASWANASGAGGAGGASCPGGVITCGEAPGSDAWRAVESRWLEPAVAQLRAGSIATLQLSAADRCFTVTARSMRRFWRRTDAWWTAFA